MTAPDISKALKICRPGTEWIFTGTDLSTIQFKDPAVIPPTLEELQAALNP